MNAERTVVVIAWAILLGILVACAAIPEEAATPLPSPVPSLLPEATAVPPTETPQADGPDLTAIDPFLIPLLHALTQTPPD